MQQNRFADVAFYIYMVQHDRPPLATVLALDTIDAHDASRRTFGNRFAASAPRFAASA
jgi:hypothetical protein